MRATRRRDTALELAVRDHLTALGHEFRVDAAPVPALRRRADLLFEHEQVAVFLDGCFWHGCPSHGTWPRANAEFWREKIRANQSRDRDTDQRLRDAGWLVLRHWEHEGPFMAARNIHAIVAERGIRGPSAPRSE
jgi:DNA mismatch endonuclease (patch repair protein)